VPKKEEIQQGENRCCKYQPARPILTIPKVPQHDKRNHNDGATRQIEHAGANRLLKKNLNFLSNFEF
jgi:hypothetical protein